MTHATHAVRHYVLPALILLFPALAFGQAPAQPFQSVAQSAQDRGVTALRPDVGAFSLTPFFGAAFSGDVQNTSADFGVALGYGANDRISLEAELGFAPGATQGTLVEFDTNIWTANGNVVYHFLAEEFTPYATVGIGVVGSDPDIAAALLPSQDNSTTTVAFNFGAGVKGALNERFGLRADIRYFNARELAPDHWRVYAGVIIRRLGR